MKNAIPDKLYFKIGEVAKMAEVPHHVLRYWESEFSTIRLKRANSKQRLYRRQDVELILRIKELLHHQGYTIAGARKVIGGGEDLVPTKQEKPQPTTNNVSTKLKKLKQELLKLQELLTTKKEI